MQINNGFSGTNENHWPFAGDKAYRMKRLFQLGTALLLSALVFSSVNCSGKQTTTVKANSKVVGLVKTWDPKLAFYTSKKDPLKSVEGLRQAEIACFGPELAGNIQAFYDAAGIHREYGNAVQVIGPSEPVFAMKGAPRLYLINTNSEPKLKGAVKVRFAD